MAMAFVLRITVQCTTVHCQDSRGQSLVTQVQKKKSQTQWSLLLTYLPITFLEIFVHTLQHSTYVCTIADFLPFTIYQRLLASCFFDLSLISKTGHNCSDAIRKIEMENSAKNAKSHFQGTNFIYSLTSSDDYEFFIFTPMSKMTGTFSAFSAILYQISVKSENSKIISDAQKKLDR